MIGHIKLPLSNDVNSGVNRDTYTVTDRPHYNNDWGTDWGTINNNANSKITLVVSNEYGNIIYFRLVASLGGNVNVSMYNYDSSVAIYTNTAYYDYSSIDLSLLHESAIIDNIKYYILTIIPDNNNNIALLQFLNKKNTCNLDLQIDMNGFIPTSNDLYNYSTCSVLYAHFVNVNIEVLTTCFKNNFGLQYVGFFGICNIGLIDSAFENCTSLRYIDFTEYCTSVRGVTATTYNKVFKGCKSLIKVNMPSYISTAITSFYQMFDGCYSLYEFDWSNLDVIIESVVDYSYMFNNCTSIKYINLPIIRQTSLYDINYGRMFYNCKSLCSLYKANDAYSVVDGTTIYIFNFGLSITISNNPILSEMFYNCQSLCNIYIRLYNTTLFNTQFLFENCKSLEMISIVNYYDTDINNNTNIKNIRIVLDGMTVLQKIITFGCRVTYLSITNSYLNRYLNLENILPNGYYGCSDNFQSGSLNSTTIRFENNLAVSEEYINDILLNLPSVVGNNRTISFLNSGTMPPTNTFDRNAAKGEAQANGWVLVGC